MPILPCADLIYSFLYQEVINPLFIDLNLVSDSFVFVLPVLFNMPRRYKEKEPRLQETQ